MLSIYQSKVVECYSEEQCQCDPSSRAARMHGRANYPSPFVETISRRLFITRPTGRILDRARVGYFARAMGQRACRQWRSELTEQSPVL